MAIYRYVYLSFWKDEKIMEKFNKEEKLLFIFF